MPSSASSSSQQRGLPSAAAMTDSQILPKVRNPRPDTTNRERSSHPLAATQPSLTGGQRRGSSHRRLSRRPRSVQRSTSGPALELPDRLKDLGSDTDSDDVKPVAATAGVPMNITQSIFGLITAAGSTVDFHNRFEGQSSDEEDDTGDDSRGEEHRASTSKRNKGTVRTSSDQSLAGPILAGNSTGKSGAHRRRISDSKLVRSLSRLSKGKSSSKSRERDGEALPAKAQPAGLSTKHKIIEEESETEFPTPLQSPTLTGYETGAKLAPVMSRMLEARAEVLARSSTDFERSSTEKKRVPDKSGGIGGESDLSRQLQDIFLFDEPEEVVSEYPCWLLQSVLLQGYLYITSKHICFYSYLPKKAHEVAKSGYLFKSGKRNPRYNRYWFRLRGEVLSYYHDSANKYFPHGQIDLRYGISASVVDKAKDGVHFSVVTNHRTYHFRADSAASAKDWVKCLQRIIFRSHNEGDAVKISLPIQNIIDVEETQMLENADTCKIRVIDNDETYAVDEYYFSFFSLGKEALRVLQLLVEDTVHKAGQPHPDLHTILGSTNLDDSSKRSSVVGGELPALQTTKLPDMVRNTLSPVSPMGVSALPSRPSIDVSRTSFDALRGIDRKSVDLSTAMPRRSFSQDSRARSRTPGHAPRSPLVQQDSSDSYVQSVDEPSQTSASGWMGASSELDQSASQILHGSDVFHNPTVRRSASDVRTRHHTTEPQAAPHRLTKPHGVPHAATTGHILQLDHDQHSDQQGPATPTLQNIAKMGAFPLQRAGAFADYLNRHTKRVSTLLATESMGYVEKVSGMWKGGQKHYGAPAGLRVEDDLDDMDGAEEHEKIAVANARFTAHFALPVTETLKATYFGYFMRVLPLYGKIYLSDSHFCYRSLLPGTRTKVIIPLKDIENVDKEKGFRFGYHGLVLMVRGHEELFFEFGETVLRDDLAVSLLHGLETTRHQRNSEGVDPQALREVQHAMAEHDALQKATHYKHDPSTPDPDKLLRDVLDDGPTIIFDDPKASFLDFKPEKSLRITCLTIGSRGDVQPYIALCKGLLADGHKPRIATHKEFRPWVEKHGIEFAEVAGDPAELMRLCIENGTFTISFLREANLTMRSWISGLLVTAWEACQGSDVLIESPSAMAGIHIAEKLGIPYFRAFGMPWTRTRAYPHAFIVPEHKMGGAYNYVTYVMFDNVFWKATAAQVNRWRNKTLGLPNTSLEKMQTNKVPFLYNFSPSVVPPPVDFSDWIRVTGYWFLDEGGEGWTPPDDLAAFIAQARKDGKKLVYVGFGSIILDNPAKFTREIIRAVQKADVRCILSKGWSNRVDPKHNHDAQHGSKSHSSTSKTGHMAPPADPRPKHAATAPPATTTSTDEVPIPPEIFVIKSAPHDWLFKQIDAAAHHGGSGTTGASLRAGLPTIVRPFFGDQFFFGSRVEDLGVGICLRKWGANGFAKALWEATHSERMIAKARDLGEVIRKEDGVGNAVQAVYRDMDYAKSLVARKQHQNAAVATTTTSAAADTSDSPDLQDLGEGEEESWTFVGGNDASVASMLEKHDVDMSKSVADLAKRMSEKVEQPKAESTILPGVRLSRSPGPK